MFGQMSVAACRRRHDNQATAKKEMCLNWAMGVCKAREEKREEMREWTPLVDFPPSSKVFGMHMGQDTGSSGALPVDVQPTRDDESGRVVQHGQPPSGSGFLASRRRAYKKEVCRRWIRGICPMSDEQCPYAHRWML